MLFVILLVMGLVLVVLGIALVSVPAALVALGLGIAGFAALTDDGKG